MGGMVGNWSDYFARSQSPVEPLTHLSPAAPPAAGGDPNVNQYIASVLTGYNSAQQAPTYSTDANGNVTEHRYSGPATYVASDGAQFTDPEKYRAYQTTVDTQNSTQKTGVAYNAAMTQARNIVNSRGLDWNTYGPQITAALDQARGAIQPYDQNPGASFDPNTATTVLGGLQAQGRTADLAAVNKQFTPNYDTTAISDSLLQPTIDNILGTAKAGAQAQADRGLARGQFNQVGYDAAENNINQQYAADQSKVGSAANDVLNSYRTKLDGVRNNAFGAASNSTLGDNFNIGDYTPQAQSVIDQAGKYAPGDLTTQVGNQPLFDLSSIIGAGGTAQGAQNMQSTDVASALAAQRQASTAQRGLGTQGSF